MVCIKFSFVNEDKTVLFYFLNRNPPPDEVSVKSGDMELDSLGDAKYLGIRPDPQLQWCDHVPDICKELNSSYYAILNTTDTIGPKSVLNVHNDLGISRVGPVSLSTVSTNSELYVHFRNCYL
ncbi:hypothetical protein HHI36_022346 [Cryptolaemus montrouzieri]|uniref:Uncharacterized protein n=1 Tax=Cryptolaemus montrouzieri TaxID=559131 RepID=A0ABD2MZT7_9CUCU